jgi:chemotaxis methyl-accepting protein methylase
VYRGNVDRLISKVFEARGIDLAQYRRPYVERRLATRLRSLDLHSYRQYADYLDHHPDEYTQLLDTLTINVTEFFRDKVVWDILESRIVPAMLKEKERGRSRTIRIWSAACATGEEPYSIAMMLLDALGDEASRYLITILGTDLDPEALAVAREGVYDIEHLRRIPPKFQVRYTRAEKDTFEVLPEVRRHVRFKRFNLFEGVPTRAVDLLFCRNVFIYFDRDQQDRVLDSFWHATARGGYLILGRSEKLSPEAAARFEAVDGRERIYRKPPVA